MQPEELPSCNSSLQKGSLLSDEQPQLTEEQAKFLVKNSPDRQHIVCKNENQCFFGDSPTLSQLGLAFQKPGLSLRFPTLAITVV